MDTGTDDSGTVPSNTEVESVGEGANDGSDESKSAEKPKRRRRRRTKKEISEAEDVLDSDSAEIATQAASDNPSPDLTDDTAEDVSEQNAMSNPTEEASAMLANDDNNTDRKEPSETTEAAHVVETKTSDEPAEPPRKGWWQRVVN